MKPGLLIRLLVYPVVVVALTMLLALHLVWYTEGGSGFVIEQIVERVPGLGLEFESGSASRGVVLADVRYDADGLSLAAAKLSIRLDGWALLGFKVGIREAIFQSLSISYDDTENDNEQSTAPVKIPVNVKIPILFSSTRAYDVTIRLGSAAPVQLVSIEASGELKGQALELKRVRVVHALGELYASSLVTLNSPYEFTSNLRLLRNGISVAGRLAGSTAGIALDGSANLPDRVDIAARFLPGEVPTFYVGASSDRVDLKELTGLDLALRHMKFESEGTMDDYRFEIESVVDSAIPGAITGLMNFQLSGSGSSSELRFNSVKLQGTDARISGTGYYGFSPVRIRVNLEGNWGLNPIVIAADLIGSDLRSLGGDANIQVADNRLTLNASDTGQYSLDLDARNLASILAPLEGSLELNGQVGFTKDAGIDTVLNVRQLTLYDNVLGQGELRFNGSVNGGVLSLDWRHALASVVLTSTVSQVDGRLSGSLDESEVSAFDQRWTLVEPANFTVVAPDVAVNDHCWQQADAYLCFSGLRLDKGDLHANATLAGLLTGLGPPVTLRDRVELDLVYRAGKLSVSLYAAGMDVVDQGVSIEHIELTLDGTPARYELQGGWDLITPATGAMSLDLLSHFTSSVFVLERLGMTGMDSELSVSGDYEFETAQVNAKVGGKLRNHDVTGSVNLSGNTLELLAGEGRLSVANNTFDFNADGAGLVAFGLDARNLGAVYQDLQGQIHVEGVLHGSTMQYEVSASSDSLTLAGHEVLTLDLRVAGRGQQLAGSLRAGHWQFGSYYLGEGEVSVEGELNDGRLALAWMHPNGHLNLNVSFGYVDGVVEGSLTEGTIQIGTQTWLLESSVDYRFASERMYLDDHCWSYESAHACVKEAGFRQGLGSLKLDLTDVPFGLESPGLAPEVDIHGQVNLHLEGTLDSTGESMLWGGRLNLDMPATVISYFDEQELVVSAAVTGEVLNNNLSARLMAQSGATNVWSVDVNVPSLPDFRQFTATTDFTTSELGIVTAFIPQLDKATGALHTAASVSTLGSEPQISLTARISEDASVVIPAAGITLSRLGMNAHTEDGDILIGLTAASGGGELSVQGALLSPLSPSRSVKLSITGNEFLLMQRPDVSIVTSPDLQIVYTDQRQLNISGKLDVVDGNFTLKDNGVQLRRQSSDVVVVSREAGSGLLQRVDIDLDVGLQRFLVEMYGLKVEVDGSVRLTQRPGFPRRGVGNVDLVSGSFSRYGQSFDVERGRLFFTGPLNNPVVDVVSSRTINERGGTVKVSLLLSGPANNLRSSIISSPAMSEARALSYLILGRSLDSADADEGRGLTSAALALGLKQAAPVTEEIRSSLGLSELTLVPSGVDSTAVIAGKRINPKLYVEYNYDVFSRIGGILFNYQLTDRLSLETRSGESKSMQLIYTME